MTKKRKFDEEVDLSVTEPDVNNEERNEGGEAETEPEPEPEPAMEAEAEPEARIEAEAEPEARIEAEGEGRRVVVGEEAEEDLTKLLEPFNKEQLMDLLRIAVSNDPKVLEEIHRVADLDPAHRKLFVHGLGWETSTEKLREFFSQYGEIEDGNVVFDKVSGKSKGYGFLLFKHRRDAQKALIEPQKKIESRMTACQLASAGPVSTVQSNSVTHTQHTQYPSSDTLPKKIYVGNVDSEIAGDKLNAFFSQYGEIEEGPLGFDKQTGRSKGFALFIYKTVEGAMKALEEPNKSFDGHQLYCQRATDSHKQRATAAAPISGGGGAAASASRHVPGAGGFKTSATSGGGFNRKGGAGFNAQEGASAASAAQFLGQGYFGGTFPFGPGIPQNQAALAALAATGQNPAAFGNPAVLAPLNPAWAAAMNASPHPVPYTAQQQAMPGFGMGNQGYHNPQAYQTNNSYQSGPMAQPHHPRPHSAVGQMGGHGAR